MAGAPSGSLRLTYRDTPLPAPPNPDFERAFDAYPPDIGARLRRLRDLIRETARETDGVGPLEETLKWGQPSFLTSESGSGTTVRIDRLKSRPDEYGLFVHCQTSLLDTYRQLYPDDLTFDGNRCLRFRVDEEPPEDVLRHCIALARTYHRNKRTR